jgi:2-phosphoglycerate kinase
MRQTLPAPEYLTVRLRHVRWIGGGSGAGKSTIARRLATAYGLRLYSSDAVMEEHARRSDPADTPLLQAFLAMDMDERWANRSPEVMFQTFHWFAGEGFDLIVDDLLALPDDPPILVEGFRLLPRLVAPLLAQKDHAVWLVPTSVFRRTAFESRGSTWKIPNQTGKPEQALSNLLIRDQIFGEEVAREAAALRLRAIAVDGTVGVDEMVRRVAHHLGLSLH